MSSSSFTWNMVLNDLVQHNMVSAPNITMFVSFPLLFVSRSGLVTTSACPPYICLQLRPSYGIHTCHLHELNTTMRGATLTTTYVENFATTISMFGWLWMDKGSQSTLVMKKTNIGNSEDILNGTSLQTKGTNNSSFYRNLEM